MVDALNAHDTLEGPRSNRERSWLTIFDSSQAQLLRSFLNPRRLEALGNSSAVHSLLVECPSWGASDFAYRQPGNMLGNARSKSFGGTASPTLNQDRNKCFQYLPDS